MITTLVLIFAAVVLIDSYFVFVKKNRNQRARIIGNILEWIILLAILAELILT